jgi:anti-sigma regulatory factor (Ser/Thr protein kinase)
LVITMSILTTDATTMTDIPPDIRADTSWAAWRLPPDDRCSEAARSLVRQTLTAMRLPDDLIHAAATIADELAVNAYVHVLGGRPVPAAAVTPGMPELWLHLIEYGQPYLVISVFDADREHSPTARAPQLTEESGRGIQIVGALSAEWGCRLARSRVGPWHAPGKTVWAAIALPTLPYGGTRARRGTSPLVAAERLHAELAARGIDRMYRNGDDRLQVISVRSGLTVWIADTISWQDGSGHYLHRDLWNVAETAEKVIEVHEHLTRN